METELKQCRETQEKTHRSPSIDDASALDGPGAKKRCTPSDAP